ncbi:hypothetical protein MJ8_56220 [Mesorhizobium sp. J8]|nr:hypothetical protein MJ8_56220 [Mesorhizobium sp. J8]
MFVGRQRCKEDPVKRRIVGKARYPRTNGQLERMNRTIKDAIVTRFYYERHGQLRQHAGPKHLVSGTVRGWGSG